MKKQLFILVMMLLPMVASAEAVEIDGLWYNLISKTKQAEVTKNPSGNYSGEIVIPDKITYEGNEYSVMSIGDRAFEWSSGLISVTIPNSVTSISGYAFYRCSGLRSITIPNGLSSILEGTFGYCLELTSVTIPNSVTSIGDRAFCGCTNLTFITIPNSVTSIGDDAFLACSNLTSITIPNSVTSIGDRAFESSGLTSVTIPNSVTSINYQSFYGCSSLTTVTFSNNIAKICHGAFSGCSSLTTVIIPNSVTSIDSYAFSKCSSLTSVTIPNSVTSIGSTAFSGCLGLSSVTIGSGISTIGNKAFFKCSNIADVFCYAESVPSTSSDAFEDSHIELTTLHVPDASLDSYKNTEPWSGFGKIVGLSGSGGTETPKCATPTISYQNGKLSFKCTTEGVEFVTDITDADIKKHYDATISLTATYNISVYATKTGYGNSDVATATLCWIEATPQTEGISNGVAQVSARAVMIQSLSGTLNIQGAEDGTSINVYDANGTQVGSAISCNGQATVSTLLQTGSIAIVKIGQKSVKVVMK